MSNAIYPVLPGLTYSVFKSPVFNTRVQQSISANEVRLALQSLPMWKFKLSYELLRDDPSVSVSPASPFDELKQIIGFYLNRQGKFDSFLFNDPSDFQTVDSQIGIGDSVTTQFQLVRAYGTASNAFVEPVTNVNALANIKSDGSIVSGAGYSVSSTGLVTFTSAPVAAKVLTWSGSYYYRVRFDDDELEFENFMQNLWSAKTVNLYGSLGSKI